MSTSGPNADLSDSITSLSKANAKLERMLAKIGTKADTPEFRDKMHQEQSGSTQQVKDLMIKLKEMNRTQHNSTVLNRLTQQFDREFKRYQALNNQMDIKQVRVIDAIKNDRARKQSVNESQYSQTSQSMYDEEDPLNPSRSDTYNGQQQQQQQQQQQTIQDLDIQFIRYDVHELEKRQKEISQIESDVLEVSDMYKDLQLMVNEQQENIDVIDGHIATTGKETEAAYNELVEAEEYQKKSRKKKCCMLFILLAVIAVIIVIVKFAK